MSRLKIVIRRAARRDLAKYYAWLASEAGVDTAERFLAATDRCFAQLAVNPGLGAEAGSRSPRLARLRKWRVDGFPRTIVFYLPLDDTLRVVRVLNTSQDWWSMLDID